MKVSGLSSMEKAELHRFRLMEKYGKIWRERVKKGTLFGYLEVFDFSFTFFFSIPVPFHSSSSVLAAFHAVQPFQSVGASLHLQHDRLPVSGRGQAEANPGPSLWVSGEALDISMGH